MRALMTAVAIVATSAAQAECWEPIEPLYAADGRLFIEGNEIRIGAMATCEINRAETGVPHTRYTATCWDNDSEDTFALRLGVTKTATGAIIRSEFNTYEARSCETAS